MGHRHLRQWYRLCFYPIQCASAPQRPAPGNRPPGPGGPGLAPPANQGLTQNNVISAQAGAPTFSRLGPFFVPASWVNRETPRQPRPGLEPIPGQVKPGGPWRPPARLGDVKKLQVIILQGRDVLRPAGRQALPCSASLTPSCLYKRSLAVKPDRPDSRAAKSKGLGITPLTLFIFLWILRLTDPGRSSPRSWPGCRGSPGRCRWPAPRRR